MERATKTKKLVPNEWYSMRDIVRGRMFPWASSVASIRKIVERDRKGKNVLAVMVTGEGTTRKYFFKGENIIKFVKAVEAGKARL